MAKRVAAKREELAALDKLLQERADGLAAQEAAAAAAETAAAARRQRIYTAGKQHFAALSKELKVPDAQQAVEEMRRAEQDAVAEEAALRKRAGQLAAEVQF